MPIPPGKREKPEKQTVVGAPMRRPPSKNPWFLPDGRPLGAPTSGLSVYSFIETALISAVPQEPSFRLSEEAHVLAGDPLVIPGPVPHVVGGLPNLDREVLSRDIHYGIPAVERAHGLLDAIVHRVPDFDLRARGNHAGQLGQGQAAGLILEKARVVVQLDLVLLADAPQLLALPVGIIRVRDDHAVDAIRPDGLLGVLHHGKPPDVLPGAHRDHRLVERIALQIADHAGGVDARADHHHLPLADLLIGQLLPLHLIDSAGVAYDHRKHKLEAGADGVDVERQPPREDRGAQYQQNRRNGVRRDDPVHVVHPRVAPHAVVQPKQRKHHQAQHRVERRELQVLGHERHRGRNEIGVNVIPQEKGQQIRCVDHDDVHHHDPYVVPDLIDPLVLHVNVLFLKAPVRRLKAPLPFFPGHQPAVHGVLDATGLFPLRMEGAHDVFDQLDDVLPVLVGRLHQALQIAQELILVKGDRAADVNQIVLRGPEALLGHQLLLIQLLPGAQAGILDFDVHVGLVAGQPDQVASQVGDLHRASHVQHEDLPAVGIGPGQHHQADGLRDGHEVADDVGMGHGHRPAVFDLLFEDRDHGAVGAQHVAEAHGHELRSDVLPQRAVAVLVGVLDPRVGEHLGDLTGLARLDLFVEALYDHLAQPLGRAHDVGGIDGLVRRDQHEPLAAVHHGRVGGLVGADGVVLDGLAGAVLHQRHVLVGRRVVDDLGTVLVKHLEYPPTVAHRPDQRLQVQLRVLLPKLQLYVIGVVFVDIEYDQLPGMVRRDLTAQLGADGPAAAGDHHHLVVDELKDLVHVGPDGLAAQQVLHRDLFHLADGHLSQHELVHGRQLHQLAVRLLADVQYVPPVLDACAGDRQEDLINAVFLHGGQYLLPAAHHLHALDIAALLAGIVVDQADGAGVRLPGPLHILQKHLSGGTRADDHDALLLIPPPAKARNQRQVKAVGKAREDDQHHLYDQAEHMIRARHAKEIEPPRRRIEHGREHRAKRASQQLIDAGVPPHAPIQPESREDQYGDGGIQCDRVIILGQVIAGNRGKTAVEPEPQRQKIRDVDGDDIPKHQKQRDLEPSLAESAPALTLMFCIAVQVLHTLPVLLIRGCISA